MEKAMARRLMSRLARLRPPVRPCPERLAEAAQAAREAERGLAATQAQAPEIRERAEHAARIHRENNIGPAVLRAVEA